MNFIISRFLRMISRDYKFDYTLTSNTDGTYLCCIINVPVKLKIALTRLKYSFVSDVREIKDKHGNTIRVEDVIVNNKVCDSVHNIETNTYDIHIVFSEKDYANKVNKLDYAIRRYFENHSQIDGINHKI